MSTKSIIVMPKEKIGPAQLNFKHGITFCAEEPITIEEFCEMVDEDTNAELVDGVIVMKSPVSEPHEALFDFLHKILSQYTEEAKLGRVRGPKSLVRITPYKGREPDLIFISQERLDIIKRVEISGGPDLVIEIVSPWDKPSEPIAKQTEYEQIGVKEFWLINHPKKQLHVYDLKAKGRFVARKLRSGVLKSSVIPGLKLQIDWLWCKPERLPSSLNIVQNLLRDRETGGSK